MDRVARWILEDDRPRRDVDVGLDQLEHPAATGDERLPILQRPFDVVVAAEGVEVVRVVVVERRLLAKAPEHRVRIGVDVDVVRVVIDVGAAHHHPLDSCQWTLTRTGLWVNGSTIVRAWTRRSSPGSTPSSPVAPVASVGPPRGCSSPRGRTW